MGEKLTEGQIFDFDPPMIEKGSARLVESRYPNIEMNNASRYWLYTGSAGAFGALLGVSLANSFESDGELGFMLKSMIILGGLGYGMMIGAKVHLQSYGPHVLNPWTQHMGPYS